MELGISTLPIQLKALIYFHYKNGDPNITLPLEDIKVIDLSEGVSGPYCGKLLAAMGADVVKVESPPFGDSSRLTGPFLPKGHHPEKSALFLHNNTGKKSVLLNWSTKQGFDNLTSLIADADVLIEDWNLPTRPSSVKFKFAMLKKMIEISKEYL